MSSCSAIRWREVFCWYSCYWLVFTLKRVKALPSCLRLPNLSGTRLHVLEMHSRLFHIFWNRPQRESSIKISPTGFNDAQIKGIYHSQDLIKRGKSFCRFAYLFMKRLWNIYKCFPDICLKIHFRASLVEGRGGGDWRRGCGWKKKRWIRQFLSLSKKWDVPGYPRVSLGVPQEPGRL